MRTYRTTADPFLERPYYKSVEVEAMCIQELQKSGLLPDEPAPIRVDRFIEKRFGVVPTYEQLPHGVLGLTKFGHKGVEEIVIARALDEDTSTSAERRIRTTLAHEAGHGLLHSHLFALSARQKTEPLFGDGTDRKAPRVLCRDEVAGVSEAGNRNYHGKWWEYQANMVIGALLLPRNLVGVALQPFLTPQGRLGAMTLDETSRGKAIASLARVFDVNPVVARIRIEEIHPARDSKQLML